MQNWEIRKLGEITSWLSGGTPKKDEPSYWNGDIPWISANSMDGTRYYTSDLKITAEGLRNGSRLAPQNSILLLVRGGALHTKIPVGIAQRPLAFNQDVKAIVVKPELIDPSFLLAWFLSKRDFLLENIVEYTGIGAGKLDTVRLQNLEIALPPIKEQRSLAHIVNCLEEKIELNRRMNDTLEGIARALFKSWFVDFDPVKAKTENRKPEGIDDVTAALFPSHFTESPLGSIPVGWTVDTLERVSYLNPESWSRNNTPLQIEYVDLANTKWGIIESTQIFLWKDAPSRAQRILRKGDTIVGTVRPGNGSYSFISSDGLTGSTGFAVLRPKKDLYREFIYLSATSAENIARLTNLADGAAYPAVRPDVVYTTPILFPGDELLLLFSQCLCPIMEKIEINKEESKTLSQIRDLLLPRLISGTLQIDEFSEENDAS